MATEREIPEATVARLPLYRRSLIELAGRGDITVSSARLAELAGVNAAKVRKDLSHLGSYGVRGVGYDVEYLLRRIGDVLGLDVEAPVVIVGMGNLGQALARYGGFESRGFPIAAFIDSDEAKIGSEFDGMRIDRIEELPRLVRERRLSVGIIATPAWAAQHVADSMVAAGIRSILNFAPTIISVPAGFPVRKVDLATELQILGYYQQRDVEDRRGSPKAG